MRLITVFVATLLLVVGCMREIDRLKKQGGDKDGDGPPCFLWSAA